MVRVKMAAKKNLAGEASNSRSKRARLSSLVEEAEDGDNVGVVAGEEVRSGTLVDLDLLNCPICYQALTDPIFQCDNGHVACSACCTKLRSKCPSCAFPIGPCRNRLVEIILESVIVTCPNAKHGCTEKFSYGKELAHEKECRFSLCYCPAPGCNYSGLCKDLYRHYHADHLDTWKGFTCGDNEDAWLEISDKILVLQERRDGPLVAVQCFDEEQGVYVTVNCIAPCAPGVSKYSCRLSYWNGGKTISFGFDEMNRVQKVSFQTPDKDFICVPRYFLYGRTTLKMEICINRLAGEEE